jgi:uncharacterized membrane protein YgcG
MNVDVDCRSNTRTTRSRKDKKKMVNFFWFCRSRKTHHNFLKFKTTLVNVESNHLHLHHLQNTNHFTIRNSPYRHSSLSLSLLRWFHLFVTLSLSGSIGKHLLLNMLLAGIKAGKKKKKKTVTTHQDESKKEQEPQGSDGGRVPVFAASSTKPPPAAPAPAPAPASVRPTTNESLAEQLRQSFRTGQAIVPVKKKDVVGVSLEDRGRILLDGKRRQRGEDDDDDERKEEVIITMGAASNNKKNQTKSDQDLTIADLVAQERLGRLYNDSSTQNEATAREILRMNKRRKVKKKNVDSDEEEERQLQTIGIMKEDDERKQQANKRTTARRQERQGQQRHEQAVQQRAVARHDAQEHIISKCWWWLEAKISFQRHRLLALGDYVSLVMTPSALSVVPGRHFYLVPIRHASSLLSCDEPVWHEIRQFQSSLRAMYAATSTSTRKGDDKKLAVLFTETVLSTSSFWQTRMECIVVPIEVALDAPLYFKNSMLEQAEEWGTHSHKIYNISSSHEKKTLVQTLPSKASNLAYFYIDFGSSSSSSNGNASAASATTTTTTTGYAQVIESSRFPKDFAADTVAGMMHLDPMRLRRGGSGGGGDRRKAPPSSRSQKGSSGGGGGGDKNASSNDEEQELIRAFLQEWKVFDWTLQLDNDGC